MKVELYFFEGCPSYTHALQNLKDALRLEQLPDTVEMIHVADTQDAQAKRLIGSPTIRIDGIDVEGPDAEQLGYAYGCRVYQNEGGPTGWPSIQRIRQALRHKGPV